jgi:hypothetical protein
MTLTIQSAANTFMGVLEQVVTENEEEEAEEEIGFQQA